MTSYTSEEIEYLKQLRQIASKIDHHIINNPGELQNFRNRIKPLAMRWKEYQQAIEDGERAVLEHWEQVKKNPELQNKSDTSFEKKGYEWDRFYLFGLDGFGSNPINEMPAKYAPDVMVSLEKYIVRNENNEQGYSENSSEYKRLQETITTQRQNLEDIRSEYDNLSPTEKKTAWIKTPPKKIIPNKPYFKFTWWRYLNLDDELVFGCWRPKLKHLPENPLDRLKPTEEEFRSSKPRDLQTLPIARNKTEEYERYYIFLSSVHDNCLPELEQITKDIWPNDLERKAWGLCDLFFGDKTAFFNSALSRIQCECATTKPKEKGPKFVPINIPIESVAKQDTEGHGDFLAKVASSVHELIQNQTNRNEFQEQITTFRKLRNDFAMALKEAQEAALAEPKLRYDYDDVRDKDKDPPLPPVEGYKVESHHVLDTPPKGFWRPPMPFNPDGWLSRFQATFLGLLDPPKEEPRDRDQMLACEYTQLAVIHDEGLDIPKCDRLTDSNKDDWVESLWVGVSEEGQTQDDIETLPNRQKYIETALNDVKTELAKKQAEAEQEAQDNEALSNLAEELKSIINRLAEQPKVQLLEDIRQVQISVAKLGESGFSLDNISREESIYAEAAVIEYMKARYGEQDDALGNWPADWNECPEAYQLYMEKVKEFRIAKAKTNIDRLKDSAENLANIEQEIASVKESPKKTEGKNGKKKKRATKAEMAKRNKTVSMTAALYKLEHEQLPTVDEIIDETKCTRNEIYATDAYKEGKIAKSSAKIASEMTRGSVQKTEYYSQKSEEHGRTVRRTKAEQAELDALIDKQKEDDSSDFMKK